MKEHCLELVTKRSHFKVFPLRIRESIFDMENQSLVLRDNGEKPLVCLISMLLLIKVGVMSRAS